MSQDGPVDPSESILRRIPCRTLDSYNPALAIPVTPFAFRPNNQDTNGISLYRERLVSPQRLASTAGMPANFYVVARLKAADVFALD